MPVSTLVTGVLERNGALLITQRSQVQILPPLQVKVQVRGPFSPPGGRASGVRDRAVTADAATGCGWLWVDSGAPSCPSEAVWCRMSLPACDAARERRPGHGAGLDFGSLTRTAHSCEHRSCTWCVRRRGGIAPGSCDQGDCDARDSSGATRNGYQPRGSISVRNTNGAVRGAACSGGGYCSATSRSERSHACTRSRVSMVGWPDRWSR